MINPETPTSLALPEGTECGLDVINKLNKQTLDWATDFPQPTCFLTLRDPGKIVSDEPALISILTTGQSIFVDEKEHTMGIFAADERGKSGVFYDYTQIDPDTDKPLEVRFTPGRTTFKLPNGIEIIVDGW